MPSLFDPLDMGSIKAPNRIFMAPLTRARTVTDFIPTPMMGEYYAQRASAGLIFSEATGISREGLGWPNAPGIWSDEQVEAWKPVLEQVHEAGGRIFCQLWHMGRLVHPDFLGGESPVSSSVTTAPSFAHTPTGKKPYEEARALTLDDISRVIDDYGKATENAKKAGFDGVQLHSANGYLIDQFIRDNSNFRTDQYGGSIENRVRLLGEVTQRLVDVYGTESVSVRLSPNGEIQGANDSTPLETFSAAATVLENIGIASLELREPRPESSFAQPDSPPIAPHIRKIFSRTLILNSDYRLDDAQAALDNGSADAIAYGRPFISNPDLPARLQSGADLTPDNFKTWYSAGPEGYVDYPALAD